MPLDPKVRLAVDLHRMEKFFPMGGNFTREFTLDMAISREIYDAVTELMDDYAVTGDALIHEVCFIILWIQREIKADRCTGAKEGNFFLMWKEVEALKQYLLQHRITSITLNGEAGRDKPGEELTIHDPINIDRICDGLRSVFREEFSHDRKKRRSKGLTAWQRRKLAATRNNLLRYINSIPAIEELSIEEQGELIDRLSGIAGITD